MNVTDRLTVRLPRVEDNQAGTYACQVAGYRPEHLNTCELEVEPGDTSCPSQAAHTLFIFVDYKLLLEDENRVN